ncbi:unnamed protein product [Ilex paraguariensis]|uniref:Uncharacterized protein n=1 Tax=Ilex paraguariensis TaxID=185542 RepID=A0ABC8TVK3_9AQUA
MAPKVIDKKLLKEIKASRDPVSGSSYHKKPRMSSPKPKTFVSSPPAYPMILSCSKTPSGTFFMLLVNSLSAKVVRDLGLDFSIYRGTPYSLEFFDNSKIQTILKMRSN